MFEAISFGALLALIAAQHFVHGRQVKAERAHHFEKEDWLQEQHRLALDHNRHLTNQIVLLKVKPQQAAFVAAADVDPQDDYLSVSDDEALAEFELERAKAS